MGPRAGLDGGKSRPTRMRSPDRPARSQSLYRLGYLALVYIWSLVENDCTSYEFRGCVICIWACVGLCREYTLSHPVAVATTE